MSDKNIWSWWIVPSHLRTKQAQVKDGFPHLLVVQKSQNVFLVFTDSPLRNDDPALEKSRHKTQRCTCGFVFRFRSILCAAAATAAAWASACCSAFGDMPCDNSSWWLNHPLEKYDRQNGFIFPKDRGENKTYLKPPSLIGNTSSIRVHFPASYVSWSRSVIVDAPLELHPKELRKFRVSEERFGQLLSPLKIGSES